MFTEVKITQHFKIIIEFSKGCAGIYTKNMYIKKFTMPTNYNIFNNTSIVKLLSNL